MPGYNLVVGKNGPKLTESAEPVPVKEGQTDEDRAKSALAAMQKRRQSVPPGPGGSSSSRQRASGPDIAQMVARMVKNPVVDMTGLTGKYDVTLAIVPETPDHPGVTIEDSLNELGLKLVVRKVPVNTVVVDQVSKVPTAN